MIFFDIIAVLCILIGLGIHFMIAVATYSYITNYNVLGLPTPCSVAVFAMWFGLAIVWTPLLVLFLKGAI